jgi:hypothetical protein
MPNTEEQRLDVIENCNILLSGILKPFVQTDDTPEGRMIAQLNWLKERAENHDLPLPVDDVYTSSLRYIYTDGELLRHASEKTREARHKEIDRYLSRLMALTVEGSLLLKPIYYPYALRSIDSLIYLLENPPRPLNAFEQGSIEEFKTLRRLLSENKIEPPLNGFPPYRNIIYAEDSLEEMPECLRLFRVAVKLVFEGVRPDGWLTPEAADYATRR